MMKVLAIAAALLLSGCALIRHDSTVCGIFPDESEYHIHGIPVEGEWAK